MNIRDSFTAICPDRELVKLHGHAKLIMTDVETGESEIVSEGDNTVLTYDQQSINEGNFQQGISQSKIHPLSQFFSGVYMTDAQESTSDNNKLISSSSNVIAQADNTGTADANNPKSGAADLSASGTKALSNGYQFTFNWGQNQGNGVGITSVCLTRGALGAGKLSTSAIPDKDTLEVLGSSSSASDLSHLTIIDYENDLGYMVEYDGANTKIKIAKYRVNCKKGHINGGGAWGVGVKIADNGSGISQDLGTTDKSLISVTFNGDGYIHILALAKVGSNDYNTIKDYKIDTSDLTAIAATDTHTYSGASFSPCNVENINMQGFILNEIPLINGYFYAYTEGNTKLAKCSASDATITEVSLPSPLARNALNGPTAILPNGDFIKIYTNNYYSGGHPCLYYHDGTVYVGKFPDINANFTALECDAYGTLLARSYMGNYVGIMAAFGHISTVYDVNPPVNKDATKMMSLVYTLTEA